MARRGTSITSTAEQAEAFAANGRWAEAEKQYRELIGQTHVVDYEYDEWLRHLADVYRHLDRRREAGYVYLYLHQFEQARGQFAGDAEVAARARLAEVEKHWVDAAKAYQQAKLPVHAAVSWERAGQSAEAAAAWSALLSHPGLRGHDYENALAHVNFGLASRASDARGSATSGSANHALVDAQRRLESVADEFETRGELERAFDCFQILLKLGRDSGQFENLAEGYVNCIRVLRQDNLKFYALQYYEDFIKLALERGELHAAATQYQEAAEFAARAGLPYDRRYQARAAETWVRAADAALTDGAPVQMVENSLLAAAAQYSAVADYASVRGIFERLALLELPERARRRYATVAGNYAGVRPVQIDAPAFPDYLKQQHAYAEIWFVDLLEWELAGDPAGVAASIVGDLRYPNGIRRRALVVLLTLDEAARSNTATDVQTLAHIGELLGELQSYAALSPLEKLFTHSDPLVRRSAVRALRFLYFKRAFVIVRQALRDADPQVREAALVAISGLHFPHALGPLIRIYHESADVKVRTTALESIGKIQSIEAGEFLIMVLRQEDGALREAAREALFRIDNADIIPIVRQHHEVESNPQTREALGALLRRGV